MCSRGGGGGKNYKYRSWNLGEENHGSGGGVCSHKFWKQNNNSIHLTFEHQ